MVLEKNYVIQYWFNVNGRAEDWDGSRANCEGIPFIE